MADIGTIPPTPPGVFEAWLKEDDPCFGKHYAASAPECQSCVMPIVVDGHITTMRRECRARKEAARPTSALAVKLSWKLVAARLVAGKSTDDIIAEMAGSSDPEIVRTARRTLSARLATLRQKGYSVPKL